MERRLTLLLLLLLVTAMYAQPRLELTPSGFPPVSFTIPPGNDEDRIETVAAWAAGYNKKGYDISAGSNSSVVVEARRDNAFFYRDRGEEYAFRIRYALSVRFEGTTCHVDFAIREIYGKDKLLESTLADYFLSDGRLKEDFREVKPSIERTANDILGSLYKRLQQP